MQFYCDTFTVRVCLSSMSAGAGQTPRSPISQHIVTEWWMPTLMMCLFKWAICLRINSLCFKALLTSWSIFSLKWLHRSSWLCTCSGCTHAAKRFHLFTSNISKTDGILHMFHSVLFSPLIMYALMSHCLDGCIFEIFSVQLFPLITRILAACRNTHAYTGHKLDCAVSSRQQRMSSCYFMNDNFCKKKSQFRFWKHDLCYNYTTMQKTRVFP